jgi:hypothetical protein
VSVIRRRALGRALLARQLLLERADLPVPEAIERLVGLQAQAPLAPYVGLWSRLAGFHPSTLSSLLSSRAVARGSLMRNTVHLMTARDCLAVRPVVQSVAERGFTASFGRQAVGIDPTEVAKAAAEELTGRTLTRTELGQRLAARWPDHDPAVVAYAATSYAAVVQPPPRGVWGSTGPAAVTTMESWLDCPLGTDAAPDALLLRYFAAFGPASVRDAAVWSGLSGVREVVDRLRPSLEVFAAVDGTELFDLPDAPRPRPEDTPAPPRFLPEYDNVLLSHADRTRINPTGRRVPLLPGNGAAAGTLLTDGEWTATWKLTRPATLEIVPFAPVPRDEVEAEAVALLDMLAPGERPDVRLRAVRKG